MVSMLVFLVPLENNGKGESITSRKCNSCYQYMFHDMFSRTPSHNPVELSSDLFQKSPPSRTANSVNVLWTLTWEFVFLAESK